MKLNSGYLLLALLIVIIVITNYQPGTILTGGDNLHPEFNPLLNIKRSIFAAWQEYQGLGLLGGMGHASDIVRQIFVLMLSFLIPLENIRYLMTFIYLFVGVFGAYFLLRKVLKPFSVSDMFPLIGSVFYLLNLATVQAFYTPFEAFGVHFAFLPWLFLSAINYFQCPNSKNTLMLGIVLLLATPAAYVPTLFLVFILSTAILVPFSLPGSTLRNNLWRIGKFYLVVFIINAFWLLPFLYFAATSGATVLDAKINQMSSDTNFLKNKEFGNIFDVALLRGFWFNNTDFNLNQDWVFLMQPWREHFANPVVPGIGYLLFTVVVMGALWTLKERRSKVIVGFLGILIFSFIMLATDTPPFSWLNSILRQIPFFAEAFRFPFTKFSILLSLTYSLFFALGLIYISEVIRKFISIREKYLTHGLVFASAALLIIFTFPLFRGHLFYEKVRLEFPAEYRELFEFFKKQDKNSRIANFPQHTLWSWNFYKWGYGGSGFLWYGIEQPILDRAFDPWSRQNENYYWEISYALYSKKQELFEGILDKYNIQWVLVDRNIINPSSLKAIFLDELEEILSASNKFKLAASFGKVQVYRVRLDTLVSSFVYLAQNLPSVEPTYKWNNFDAAFAEQSHHISPIHDSRYLPAQADSIPDTSIIYPFRSLFTGKRQEDIEFQIEETENSFIFSKTFDRPLQDYSLKIPEIDSKALTWVNPYDLAHRKFLHPDVFFDGTSLTVEIPKIKGYFSEQINPAYDSSLSLPKNCSNFENGAVQNEIIKEKDTLVLRLISRNANNCSASFFLPNLPHNIGYLITAEARNRQGRSLLFWLENQNTRKADLETYLPAGRQALPKNGKFHSIQPPMQEDGVGYSLHFDNISIGKDKTVNDLGKITVNPIPYEFLTQIFLQLIVPSVLPRTENFPVEVEHLNPSLYLVSKVTSQQDSKDFIIVLSQAYNPGWNAYISNSQSPMLNAKFLLPFFGEKLENHVLVNNWSNGWILDSRYLIRNTKIVLIFLPQYLEYLGFLLLIVFGLVILKNRMADNTKPLGEIVLEEEGEGRAVKNPAASPAIQDEGSASGSAPDVRSDDDVGKMVEQVAGREPEPGETFTDIINSAEEGRRRPPEETEEKEE